eukprot:scaffold17078_cov90-Skeletonema_marinoi.AAC.1
MVLEYCRPPSKLSLIRSPTTLQHGRYADKELEQRHIFLYTIVTNVNGSLEAVDCYIHSARYDMVLESPTTLQHGRYTDKELEQRHISFYTIVTNVNGSLEAVDCYIHSPNTMGHWKLWIAIFTALDTICCETGVVATQFGPHQVTYYALATLIR